MKCHGSDLDKKLGPDAVLSLQCDGKLPENLNEASSNSLALQLWILLALLRTHFQVRQADMVTCLCSLSHGLTCELDRHAALDCSCIIMHTYTPNISAVMSQQRATHRHTDKAQLQSTI